MKLCSFMTKSSSPSTTGTHPRDAGSYLKTVMDPVMERRNKGEGKHPGLSCQASVSFYFVFARLLHSSLWCLPLCTGKCPKVSCLSKLSSSWTFGCREKTFHGLLCPRLLALPGSWLLQDSLGLHEAKGSSGSSLLYHSSSPKFLS